MLSLFHLTLYTRAASPRRRQRDIRHTHKTRGFSPRFKLELERVLGRALFICQPARVCLAAAVAYPKPLWTRQLAPLSPMQRARLYPLVAADRAADAAAIATAATAAPPPLVSV